MKPSIKLKYQLFLFLLSNLFPSSNGECKFLHTSYNITYNTINQNIQLWRPLVLHCQENTNSPTITTSSNSPFTATLSPALNSKYYHITLAPKTARLYPSSSKIFFKNISTVLQISYDGPTDFTPPDFTKSSVSLSNLKIAESTLPGTVIHEIKANRDCYYAINSYSDYFAINAFSGQIFLTSELDFHTQASHAITILAIDKKLQYANGKLDFDDLLTWEKSLPKFSFSKFNSQIQVQPSDDEKLSFQRVDFKNTLFDNFIKYGELTSISDDDVVISTQSHENFVKIDKVSGMTYGVVLDLGFLPKNTEPVTVTFETAGEKFSINVDLTDVLPDKRPQFLSDTNEIDIPAFLPAKSVAHVFKAKTYDFTSDLHFKIEAHPDFLISANGHLLTKLSTLEMNTVFEVFKIH